jgi:hypothetical protein
MGKRGNDEQMIGYGGIALAAGSMALSFSAKTLGVTVLPEGGFMGASIAIGAVSVGVLLGSAFE